jgi:large subunit ribosomal protein L19
MVTYYINTMSDDQKTTGDSADSTDSAEKKEESQEEKQLQPEKEDSASSTDEKTALDEVIKEADKPKSKKGKSDYTELKPEEIKPGMLIRVHQKIVDTNPKGEEKERTQIFQGMVLAHKHGAESGSTITVRKVSEGIGVEKIFPLNMPSLTKFELVRKYSVRQARPYFLRTHKKRLREVKE